MRKDYQMGELTQNEDYISFLKTVESEIQSARIRAAKTLNRFRFIGKSER